jgi:Tfp pilus assembly protein PilF
MRDKREKSCCPEDIGVCRYSGCCRLQQSKPQMRCIFATLLQRGLTRMRPIRQWFWRQRKPASVEADSIECPSPGVPDKQPRLGGLFGELITGGVVLTLFLMAAGLVASLVGYCVRSVDPETQIILAGFTGPFDLKSDAGSVLGKQASDVFSGDVNEIIETGRNYIGDQGASSKSRVAQPLDPVPQVPISRNYGITIQGISIDQIISAWHSIRYYQVTVSGDIVPDEHVPGKYVLYLSWRMGKSSYNWTSRSFSATDEEMEPVLDDAAMHFVRETNPELAGRFYLSQGQYSQAVATFSDWVGREPRRPEPFLYLARTFDSNGDYSRGLPFAERAQELLSRAPRRARKNLQVGINLAKSLQFVGPKEQFSNFESYVHQNLPNDPNALMNLGLRYLQMGRYDKAEDFLKQVLAVDQGDFAAEVYLGESYEGQKDHAKAAQAYMAALRLSPQSPTAATGYVEALYQSPNYLDAARFCSAWVYPEGSSGVISGLKTQDLFFLCAEAERGSGDTSKDRLQWYYVQSLIHPEAEQPDVMVAIADSKTLVTRHSRFMQPLDRRLEILIPALPFCHAELRASKPNSFIIRKKSIP